MRNFFLGAMFILSGIAITAFASTTIEETYLASIQAAFSFSSDSTAFPLPTRHSQTARPSVTACGTGTPIVATSSTDNVGRVRTGSSVTSCRVTFTTPWPNAPVCFAQNDSSTTVNMVATTSATSMTIRPRAGTVANTSTLSWICYGYQ